MSTDLVNGLFELTGGIINFLNVLALWRDKRVVGVCWQPTAFFTSWAVWNLFYYPSLEQWFSLAGGIVIMISNGMWVVLAIWYMRNSK